MTFIYTSDIIFLLKRGKNMEKRQLKDLSFELFDDFDVIKDMDLSNDEKKYILKEMKKTIKVYDACKVVTCISAFEGEFLFCEIVLRKILENKDLSLPCYIPLAFTAMMSLMYILFSEIDNDNNYIYDEVKNNILKYE